jgi:hypothetical protein
MDTGRDTPIALRLSAVLLVVSGAVLGTFVVAVSALMIRRWIVGAAVGKWPSIGMALAFILAAIFSYWCVRTAISLFNGRHWAGYAAIVFGLLLIGLNGWIITANVHSADDYFQPFFSIPTMFFGLCWCVLPLLPASRSYMRDSAQRGANAGSSLRSG